MSGYASVILRPGGVIYHTPWADSHESIIRALGLGDSAPPDQVGGLVGGEAERRFLRAGAPDGDMARYYADEDDPDHLPAWYMEHEAEYRDGLAELIPRVNALRDRRDALRADYEVKNTALYIDFSAKRDALFNDFVTGRDALYARYNAQRDELRANLSAKRDALYTEYLVLPGAMRPGGWKEEL